jgi:DNA primase catalytic core, N-terminal domain
MPTTLVAPPSQGTKWQSAASDLVQHAHRTLFSSQGKDAQLYLHSIDINTDTIKHFKLGYMPESQQFSFSNWGIDPSTLTSKQRDKGGINIPDGIIVPWYVDGKVHKITVKRPGKTPEYGQIVGSIECLFNGDSIQANQPAIIIESEFSAMNVWQEAGDIVNVVATGDEKKCRSAKWLTDLSLARVVLQSFEKNEHAGYWTSILKNCLRWQRNNEISLRQWIQDGILCQHISTKPLDLTNKFDQESPLSKSSTQTPTIKNTPLKTQENLIFDTIGMCEICRFNPAIVIWKKGKRYCAYCYAR